MFRFLKHLPHEEFQRFVKQQASECNTRSIQLSVTRSHISTKVKINAEPHVRQLERYILLVSKYFGPGSDFLKKDLNLPENKVFKMLGPVIHIFRRPCFKTGQSQLCIAYKIVAYKMRVRRREKDNRRRPRPQRDTFFSVKTFFWFAVSFFD